MFCLLVILLLSWGSRQGWWLHSSHTITPFLLPLPSTGYQVPKPELIYLPEHGQELWQMKGLMPVTCAGRWPWHCQGWSWHFSDWQDMTTGYCVGHLIVTSRVLSGSDLPQGLMCMNRWALHHTYWEIRLTSPVIRQLSIVLNMIWGLKATEKARRDMHMCSVYILDKPQAFGQTFSLVTEKCGLAMRPRRKIKGLVYTT